MNLASSTALIGKTEAGTGKRVREMLHSFWAGTVFGAIAIILPSLTTFAYLLVRAPHLEDGREYGRNLMPHSMECPDAGL